MKKERIIYIEIDAQSERIKCLEQKKYVWKIYSAMASFHKKISRNPDTVLTYGNKLHNSKVHL